VNTPYVVGPVHFYTFELTDGTFMMFDTGPFTDEAVEYLTNNVPLQRLSYLFITHCHTDHYGLLHYIKQNSPARAFIPLYDMLKLIHKRERLDLLSKILFTEGFPVDVVEAFQTTLYRFESSLPLPDAEILENNSELLQHLNLSYISCPGHSQSDVVYLYENFAISGDVILEDIFQSPFLDADLANFRDRYNNYDAFVSSADKLLSLKHCTFLPGHRYKIDDIKYRVSVYIEKILGRAMKIGHESLNEKIFYNLKKLNIDPLKEPFIAYVKTSEFFFMRDMVNNPQPLKDLIDKYELNININAYF
jgi:glyoxylase-like metal-dependent hydrolase (beta-lactamase superfamily II)